MTSGILDWLQHDRAPQHFAELLGLPPLVKREEAAVVVQAAYKALLPYQAHPDRAQAQRAQFLMRQLGSASAIINNEKEWEIYQDSQVAVLHSLVSQQFGADSAAWPVAQVHSWLLTQHQLHPENVETLLDRWLPSLIPLDEIEVLTESAPTLPPQPQTEIELLPVQTPVPNPATDLTAHRAAPIATGVSEHSPPPLRKEPNPRTIHGPFAKRQVLVMGAILLCVCLIIVIKLIVSSGDDSTQSGRDQSNGESAPLAPNEGGGVPHVGNSTAANPAIRSTQAVPSKIANEAQPTHDTPQNLPPNLYRTAVDPIRLVAFSPDERHVYSQTGNSPAGLRLWNVKTGEEVPFSFPPKVSEHTGAWGASSDGRHLFFVGGNRLLRAWNLDNKTYFEVKVPTNAQAGLTGDGLNFIIISNSGICEFWNISTGQKAKPTEPFKPPSAVRLSDLFCTTDGLLPRFVAYIKAGRQLIWLDLEQKRTKPEKPITIELDASGESRLLALIADDGSPLMVNYPNGLALTINLRGRMQLWDISKKQIAKQITSEQLSTSSDNQPLPILFRVISIDTTQQQLTILAQGSLFLRWHLKSGECWYTNVDGKVRAVTPRTTGTLVERNGQFHWEDLSENTRWKRMLPP